MSDIGFTILGFAIGYFWAMYRADNINLRIETLNNNVQINVREFWRQAEEWRERQEKKELRPWEPHE